jgi:hypothetical protein
VDVEEATVVVVSAPEIELPVFVTVELAVSFSISV